jgi:hypothetical protein
MRSKTAKIISFCIFFLVIIVTLSSKGLGSTVTVCTASCNSTTIQGGIDKASNGDIINILNNTYTENVTVNRSVTLNATPYILLTGGFNVSVNNVTIQGFNITSGIALDQSATRGTYWMGIGIHRLGILISSNNNTIYNNYFINITGEDGANGDDDVVRGGDGGIGSAIYLTDSSNNNISNNIITQVYGGVGGYGGYSASGGTGGEGIGIYLTNSSSNDIINNTIKNINGSNGGNGNFRGSGGAGGLGAGIYLINSINNNLSLNNLTDIYGGKGGSPGIQASGSFGANQSGFGIYINTDSYNNYIDSTNIVDANNISYYYNKTGITIRDNVLTQTSNPTNLGKIVLINCSNFVIYNNTIANFTGENGRTSTADSALTATEGGIGSGIYLINSSNNNITQNTIKQIYGGNGGTGGLDTSGQTGGNSYGIYLSYSLNNNITNNAILQITGGDGGTGGREGTFDTVGGTGGIASAIYLINSTNNNISLNNISQITGGVAGAAGQAGDPGTPGIGSDHF